MTQSNRTPMDRRAFWGLVVPLLLAFLVSPVVVTYMLGGLELAGLVALFWLGPAVMYWLYEVSTHKRVFLSAVAYAGLIFVAYVYSDSWSVALGLAVGLLFGFAYGMFVALRAQEELARLDRQRTQAESEAEAAARWEAEHRPVPKREPTSTERLAFQSALMNADWDAFYRLRRLFRDDAEPMSSDSRREIEPGRRHTFGQVADRRRLRNFTEVEWCTSHPWSNLELLPEELTFLSKRLSQTGTDVAEKAVGGVRWDAEARRGSRCRRSGSVRTNCGR